MGNQSHGGRKSTDRGVDDSKESTNTRWIFAFDTEGEAGSEQVLCKLCTVALRSDQKYEYRSECGFLFKQV